MNKVVSSGSEDVSGEDVSDKDVSDEDASGEDVLWLTCSALARVFIRRACLSLLMLL